MRKLLFILCAVLMLVGATAQPASAAPANCPAGEDKTCLYANTNYGGVSLVYYLSSNPPCKSLTGLAINNNAESIWGGYDGWWIVYFNSHNCTGSSVFSSGGGAYSQLPVSARNTISSFKVLPFP